MISEKCCILEKSRKNLVKFGENSAKFWQNLRIFGEKKQQKFQQFLTKILRLESGFLLFGVVLARLLFPQFSHLDSKTVRRSALCRSRRELSNEYLLAKFGFDTAENEPI